MDAEAAGDGSHDHEFFLVSALRIRRYFIVFGALSRRDQARIPRGLIEVFFHMPLSAGATPTEPPAGGNAVLDFQVEP
jgi:hypothetical protein